MSNISIIYAKESVLVNFRDSYSTTNYSKLTKAMPGGAFACYYKKNNTNYFFLASFNNDAAKIKTYPRSGSTINIIEPTPYLYDNQTWYICQCACNNTIKNTFVNYVNITDTDNAIDYILNIIKHDYYGTSPFWHIQNNFDFTGIEYTVTDIELVSIADAIRIAKGITGSYPLSFPGGFISGIQTISAPELVGGNVLIGNISGIVTNNVISQIRSYGCYNNLNLQFISCNSVESIGDYTFHGCVNLSDMNLPKCSIVGSSAFASCTSLSYVNLPECTYIQSHAFQDCSNLLNIDLSKCIAVSGYAFCDCTSLSYVNLPECTTVGDSVNKDIIYNLTKPGECAFYGCTNLLSISLPKCRLIGHSTFQNCTNLSYIDLSECSYVGSLAFSGCTNLISVNLPKCTSLGNSVFYNCTNLSNINLQQCSLIVYNAFYNCINLSVIDLPQCSYIGTNAFYYCTNLTSINLPKCTSIFGSSTFYSCNNLSVISLPECSYIGSSVFMYMRNLKQIWLFKTDYIGSYFAWSCPALESIFIFTSTVPTLESNVFNYSPMRVSSYLGYYGSIFVWPSLYSAFITAANWSTVSSRITSFYMTEG